jgi:hypothetical protein
MSLFAPVREQIRRSWLWHEILAPIRDRHQVRRWTTGGMAPPPPHAVKVRQLLAVADLFALDTMIETGTYRGQMIDAVQHRFVKIWSIEVFPPLATAARQRFLAFPHIQIVEGDSAMVMPRILSALSSTDRAVFWLDGHYSGEGTGRGGEETPILREIEHIAAVGRDGDAILIDDARCFTGADGYPELARFVDMLVERLGRYPLVANDTIFLLPEWRPAEDVSQGAATAYAPPALG